VPDWLVGDIHRLRQIVTNLVGNAIKFTEGEVVVDVATECSTADEVQLRFSVRRHGDRHLAGDKLATIFRPSSRRYLDHAAFWRHGTGTGDRRRLVELMGGRIWVESQVGRGSRFLFTAALNRGKAPLRQPQTGDEAG
jgi:two-component system, sensor histidine kinase and response regulator